MIGLAMSSARAEGTEGRPSRRAKWVLLGALAAGLTLLACAALFLRPGVSVNRLFSTCGLAGLPPSTRDLLIERQGRLFGTRAIYVRFEASAEGMARFFRGSSITTADGPAPMAGLSFGPRCPTWMTWETTVQGRMYHWTTGNASVWLAIDDESHTVYVGVFESRSPWLSRLFD